MNDKSTKIQSYLYYGYLPPEVFPDWLDECFELKQAENKYDASGAAQLIMSILDEEIEKYFVGARDCVIPISGGWDSRFLLAAAMKRFEKNRIKLLSFGVPGQLDFDIGKRIAKKYAIDHAAINLECLELTWEELLLSVKANPWTYVPDSYFNRYSVLQAVKPGDVILSGFLGEALTGGHYSCLESVEDTKIEFVKRQKRSRFRLTSSDFDPLVSIPQVSISTRISMSEYWDIAIRQSNCITPIVTPEKKMTRWGDYRGEIGNKNFVIAPFSHPLWANFWLNVPKNDKKNQKLYLSALMELSPDLANFPSKYSYGAKPASLQAWLAKKVYVARKHLNVRAPNLFTSPKSMLNYLDYEKLFRVRNDYLNVLTIAFEYLSKNNVVPWLNLDNLMRSHLTGKENYANEFLLLIGLALNLEVEASELVESEL